MIGPACALTALPVDERADAEATRVAQRFLRCSTCAALVSVSDLVKLEPGTCPAVADAAGV